MRTSEATIPLVATDQAPVSAGVRELRDHLSRYLDVVKAGHPVTVTEHGAVIASIVPVRISSRTMELYREGKVDLPTGPKADVDAFLRPEVQGGTADILDDIRSS